MAWTFHPGVRVQEIAGQHRKGTVIAVHGRGSYAQVYVHLDGRGFVMFQPAALTIA